MTPTALAPVAADPAPPPSLLDEPTFDECHAEALRFNADWVAGRITFEGVPDGHFVAYYDGRIVDHDADGYALQGRAAAALGVHFYRVYVSYPWMW